eukprot:5144579-Pleurochrysis_carterae.AAC.1
MAASSACSCSSDAFFASEPRGTCVKDRARRGGGGGRGELRGERSHKLGSNARARARTRT